MTDSLPLPGFAYQRADGLYLDAGEAGNPANIVHFIDRIYANNAYLHGLNYATLQALLYPQTDEGQTASSALVQRIADAVMPFPDERQALYRNIKVSDGGARVEYVFEPVHIERSVEIPLFGPDTDGNIVQTGTKSEIESEPTQLSVDEFVAAMWQKGLRCGIDIEAVASTIANLSKNDVQRVTIAQRVTPRVGNDATLSEQTDTLHRDDAPKILPNGKVDLSQFTNRFPQVNADTRLLKKESRRLGAPGYEIDGKRIEPEIPRDFSLDDLAGAGTRIERTAEGEFVVAARDGFLHIDAATGQISVSDKIINKTGVSLRTTGNLTLSGDVFEEHGEVQEKRVVEGRHMSFLADVFGSIVSSGGDVHCAANLVGGSVTNPRGTVRVDQRCSNTLIEARGGSITLALAEGCTLIANSVTIEQAIGCNIVADDIAIGSAVATAMLGRRIAIKTSSSRREINSLVSVAVPDFSALDARIAETEALLADFDTRIATATKQRETLMTEPELRTYLAMDAAARAGKIKLTPAQEAQMQQLALKYSRNIQALRDATRTIDQASKEKPSAIEELNTLRHEREHATDSLFVEIGEITGDTLVRSMRCAHGSSLLPGVGPGDLRTRLRDPSGSYQKLTDSDSGSFSWSYASTPP